MKLLSCEVLRPAHSKYYMSQQNRKKERSPEKQKEEKAGHRDQTAWLCSGTGSRITAVT